MASITTNFEVCVFYDRIPNRTRHLAYTKFLLHIPTFLVDDYESLREDRSQDFKVSFVMPEIEFGSYAHRYFVAERLLGAGFPHNDRFYSTLDNAFSQAATVLQHHDQSRDTIISFTFCVNKIVRRYDDEDALEATAMELSMQEDPKLVPATKESIQALRKVNLDDDCMICLEKLTKVVSCMPCSHIFHEDCIEKWLNITHVCPLCRFPMPTS